ncbi:MAG: acetyltransferase [Betaproteobacteria bacterium]|nr:MAG: acetyltransferase [Betaproteobacteria bacterium]
MQGVVIYGVGSPVVVDIESSLERAGVRVVAAVRNVPGAVHLLDRTTLMETAEVTPEVRSYPFVVPLFTPANRQKAAREALASGFEHALSLIDASVACPRAMQWLQGLYVNSGCSLGAASRFDTFVFINRGASVGHHVELGAFASIGPGAVIAGQVRMGKGAVVGAGAVVLPGLTIGDNAVVGAGSVVTKSVPDHCLALGNPARIVRDDIPGYGNMSVTD